MLYTKPPLSVQEQIILLQSRGLIVSDAVSAEQFLGNVSYYRFAAYLLPLQLPPKTHHTYKVGSTFEQAAALYTFDSRLRTIIFDAMELVEIAVRTQIIYQYALKHGSHWYCNAGLFSDPYFHASLLRDIEEQCKQSQEVFIRHYRNKYTNPPLPPAWMSIEILSFGQLSKLYKKLHTSQEKKQVARHFSIHESLFESWIHSITYVRNMCAHHSRLWNRELGVRPKLPANIKNLKFGWPGTAPKYSDRIYSIIAVLHYLLRTIKPQENLGRKVLDLLREFPEIDPTALGVPANGFADSFWQI